MPNKTKSSTCTNHSNCSCVSSSVKCTDCSCHLDVPYKVYVEYKAPVCTACGWRSSYFKGIANRISDKRIEILKITHINDEKVSKYMSITGANRQKFNGDYAALNEVGKKKNISSLYKISNEPIVHGSRTTKRDLI